VCPCFRVSVCLCVGAATCRRRTLSVPLHTALLNVGQRLEPPERLAWQGSVAEFLERFYEPKAAAATQRERQSGADW
jgi:hypothetical protein